MVLLRRLLAFLAALVVALPAWAAPSWVTALSVGQWYEIPNTNLADADPAVTPNGVEGPAAKVDDWTSFIVDPSTSKLYSVAQGGHNGYAGNEVDVLPLDTETPGWTELLAPTTNANLLDADYYADGRPTSRHSYHGVTFDPVNSRIMLFSGSKWNNGNVRGRVDSYNIGSNTYSASGTHPDFPEPALSWIQNSNYIGSYATNPATGDVYFSLFSGVSLYWIRSTNSWTAISGTAPVGYYAMSAYDTTRDRAFVLSDEANHYYDVLGDGAWHSVSITGAAATDVDFKQGAMFYVPALDKYFVRGSASGGTVYQIDASTFEATVYSTTGGASVPSTTNGPFNKFLYVPDLGGAIYYPAYGQNAWFLKLHEVAGTPTYLPFRTAELLQ